ncbi:hypothetical protein [Halomicrococcus gelatinilyticus]|uniref:hypothetical protein n=1 Tax=Halomicrococcus gelatinilyticus TaxID=1702103 RepID=UPI002E15ECF3
MADQVLTSLEAIAVGGDDRFVVEQCGRRDETVLSVDLFTQREEFSGSVEILLFRYKTV